MKKYLVIVLFGILSNSPFVFADMFDVCSTNEDVVRWVQIYEEFEQGKSVRRIRFAHDADFNDVIFDEPVNSARQFLVSGHIKMRYETSSSEVRTDYPASSRNGTGRLATGDIEVELDCVKH